MILTVDRMHQQRDDGFSTTLQVGLAAEHLVCADLLLQGKQAFMATPGSPYDIVVDSGYGKFCRVQVKATCKMFDRYPSRSIAEVPIYRFALRLSRTGQRRISKVFCDVVAFVALDRHLIAYMPIKALMLADGKVKTLMEFKSRSVTYERKGKRGNDPATTGKFIEDYAKFQ